MCFTAFDCQHQIPWTNLLRSPGGATWSVLGVGGAPSGFFFFGGALAWSGLYSWRWEWKETHESRIKKKAASEEGRFPISVYEALMLHLKRRPVHMHPRAVVVAEPLQVLLRVCSQDRALQLSVYCGVAAERKMEQIATMKVPEETWGCCQFGHRTNNVVQNLGWEGSNAGSWQDSSVSLSFLLTLKPSTAEVFGLNNSDNPLWGCCCLCCYSFPKSLQCVVDEKGHVHFVVLLLKNTR